MSNTKDKDTDKSLESPLTDKRLARIVEGEKKTFKGAGVEVKK